MSPIAQSVESPSLASTSTVSMPVERYTVFLAVPLVIVALLIVCALVVRAAMRKRQPDAAREADVESGTEYNEPRARMVNLSAKHIVVVKHAETRRSMYVTSDAIPTRATYAAAPKTPAVVEGITRCSTAVEFDIANAMPAPLPRACCKPERNSVSTRATRQPQPALEAWWVTPKAARLAVKTDVADAWPRDGASSVRSTERIGATIQVFNEAWWTPRRV